MEDRMSKRLLSGLRKAIEFEQSGHYFYLMAAESMKDSKGKKLFKKLADEELEHKNFLEIQYKSILKTGKTDSKASLNKGIDLSGDSPLFSDGLRKRIKDAHFEVSAITIAINLELNSIKHYKAEAKAAKESKAKKFFEALVKWETGHYDALIRQDKMLKEEYWEKSGFAPF
jgi:rubrerythrin